MKKIKQLIALMLITAIYALEAMLEKVEDSLADEAHLDR